MLSNLKTKVGVRSDVNKNTRVGALWFLYFKQTLWQRTMAKKGKMAANHDMNEAHITKALGTQRPNKDHTLIGAY